MENKKLNSKKEKLNIRKCNYIIISKEDNNKKLSFYLIEPSGKHHFLFCHRKNIPLSNYFNTGRSIGEIVRLKNARSHRQQKIIHSALHLYKVAEDYIKYELNDYLLIDKFPGKQIQFV